jgi:hypothetical protein
MKLKDGNKPGGGRGKCCWMLFIFNLILKFDNLIVENVINVETF